MRLDVFAGVGGLDPLRPIYTAACEDFSHTVRSAGLLAHLVKVGVRLSIIETAVAILATVLLFIFFFEVEDPEL